MSSSGSPASAPSGPSESKSSSPFPGRDSKRWGAPPVDSILLQAPTRLPRRRRTEWWTVAAWSLALLAQIVMRLDEDFSYGPSMRYALTKQVRQMMEAYSNSTILLCILGLISCLVLLGTESLRAAVLGTSLAAITLTASLVSWTVMYGLWPIDAVWWTRGWVVNIVFGIVLFRAIRDLAANINESFGHRYEV
ncbi:hypothetical protein [Actinomyces ruminicola]|uniref:hypothetical protein n=1 Tax=Actinomyces ruminicola TaxID=332524 RepID=UPI0016507004|nr:hypothetical protein [Actinomyces ruminicola]